MNSLLRKVSVRVFSKDEDSEELILNSLKSLFPFSLEDEKVEISRCTASGFGGAKILILELSLSKQRHLNAFLKSFVSRLGSGQKETLLIEKESRLDENLDFFIRLDKQILAEKKEFFITDSGSCFHITLSIAAFPAKREQAMKILEKIFKPCS